VGAYSAPPNPLAGLSGTLLLRERVGDGREGNGTGGEGMGREGTAP